VQRPRVSLFPGPNEPPCQYRFPLVCRVARRLKKENPKLAKMFLEEARECETYKRLVKLAECYVELYTPRAVEIVEDVARKM